MWEIMTGISLHIGLNYVNPAAYGGWDGELNACVLDSQDMEIYARGKGFKTQMLHDSQATASTVLSIIRAAASQLVKGDIFALTYSGHGGQVPDPREDDGRNETWVLWDRQLLDDEIYAALCDFKKGVRILVLSDSCHSGSVIRAMRFITPHGDEVEGVPAGRSKLMPMHVQMKDYDNREDEYRQIQNQTARRDLLEECEATAILVSGCQDNQVSYDGDRNGAFTAAARRILAQSDAGKRMGYRGFRRRIIWTIGPWQSPNYFTIGPRNRKFELQQPFTV